MTALSTTDADRTAALEAAEAAGRVDEAFLARFDAQFARLHALFTQLYGDRPDGSEQLAATVAAASASWNARPLDLKVRDGQRAADPEWFQSERMLGGVCYVDRYAGNLAGIRDQIPYFRELGLTYLHLMPLFDAPDGDNDGGYAVSSYRRVNPSLGTMAQLAELAAELRLAGISLVLDFIFNHTSDEHEWAQKAVAGDPDFKDFYLIFPDRDMPDAYELTTREIFPDDHPGSFVQLEDGRWIWSTFYHYQWDLNYANPAVFRAMAGEMLFLANQGVEVLRMDAVAFIWKRLGTACESLPEAHLLLQAFNAVLAMAAPGMVFKSEAIVHPDEVIAYISPDECELSYNPLQMALTWEALATRDGRLLQDALERRHALPAGTAWVNYVRSHDDVGWTFADEDAAALGIDALWMKDEGIVDNARRIGEDVLGPGLAKLAETHDIVGDARGVGVFWALELVEDAETKKPATEAAATVAASAKKNGLLVIAAGNRLHIVPPCTVSDEEISTALSILDEALGSLS